MHILFSYIYSWHLCSPTPLFFTPFFSTRFHLLSRFLLNFSLHKFSHLISFMFFLLSLPLFPFFSLPLSLNPFPLVPASHQFSIPLLLVPCHTFFLSPLNFCFSLLSHTPQSSLLLSCFLHSVLFSSLSHSFSFSSIN